MTSPRASAPQDPLDRVLAPQPPPFALLHRPETVGPGLLEVVIGEVSTLDSLAELPLRTQPAHPGRAAHEVLALLP